ncbi:MAG TPA: glycosyltransferase [Verrucomicrobiae bacterium]|nr:glycosyltransferase [Verrucomicrobiae bacterium]
MAPRPPLTVAWISYFPIEWLPQLPELLRNLPKLHPATWQRVLLDELRARTDLKLHVFAVRKHFPQHQTFEWEGVTFHCLKVPGGFRTLSLFWWETLLLRPRLKALRPDLVHAWGTERGAAMVASRLRYPYLVTMQGLLEWYLQQVDLGRVMRLESRLERISLKRASVVTVESRFGVDWLRRHYPHLEVRQAEHAPNWLFHQVQRRPQLRPLHFLFVGIMSLIKGTDLLLHALDRLRTELDFRLTVVGSAPAEFLARMKASTSAALWERITLRHGLSQAQVAEEMARATMVLFPTRADNSPNSVKEAVVAGVPVVASAIGGIVDYVLPDRNGITFPAGDLEELVRAIRAAAAHPLFSQGQVQPQTLRQMREYLSPRKMATEFFAAYERAAREPIESNRS